MRNAGHHQSGIGRGHRARGLKDGLSGKQSDPCRSAANCRLRHVLAEAAATSNKRRGQDFLAKNGKEKGVVTTASGLQYKVIAAGDKKAPPIAPPTGDGALSRQAARRHGIRQFVLARCAGDLPGNGVIKGWQEALVLMKPGAKWQLFIPPELAYGATPQPKIPPDSLLIFEVSVISAANPAAGRTAAAAPPGTPNRRRARISAASSSALVRSPIGGAPARASRRRAARCPAESRDRSGA